MCAILSIYLSIYHYLYRSIDNLSQQTQDPASVLLPLGLINKLKNLRKYVMPLLEKPTIALRLFILQGLGPQCPYYIDPSKNDMTGRKINDQGSML